MEEKTIADPKRSTEPEGRTSNRWQFDVESEDVSLASSGQNRRHRHEIFKKIMSIETRRVYLARNPPGLNK